MVRRTSWKEWVSGDVADVTVLTLDASALGGISTTATLVSSFSDLPACFAGSTMSCTGAAINGLSFGLGGAGTLLDSLGAGGDLADLLDKASLATGSFGVGWDIGTNGASAGNN